MDNTLLYELYLASFFFCYWILLLLLINIFIGKTLPFYTMNIILIVTIISIIYNYNKCKIVNLNTFNNLISLIIKVLIILIIYFFFNSKKYINFNKELIIVIILFSIFNIYYYIYKKEFYLNSFSQETCLDIQIGPISQYIGKKIFKKMI